MHLFHFLYDKKWHIWGRIWYDLLLLFIPIGMPIPFLKWNRKSGDYFNCTPVRKYYEKKVFVAAVQYSRSKKFILKVVKKFSPNFKRGNLELWCLRFTTDVCRISILFRFGSLYQKYHPKKQSTQLGTFSRKNLFYQKVQCIFCEKKINVDNMKFE